MLPVNLFASYRKIKDIICACDGNDITLEEAMKLINSMFVKDYLHKRYVYAVRIYIDPTIGYKVMADLAFGDGGRPNGEITTIEWDVISEREKYVINAYTFIWDEREVPNSKTFEEFINNK